MTMPLLSRLEKVNYSPGSTAEVIAITTTSSFLLIFYNQVLGIPASHDATRAAIDARQAEAKPA